MLTTDYILERLQVLLYQPGVGKRTLRACLRNWQEMRRRELENPTRPMTVEEIEDLKRDALEGRR